MAIILAPGTGAANSDDFDVRNVPKVVSVYPEANLAAETGILKRKNTDGTYSTVQKDGTDVALGDTAQQYVIYGSGTYRLEFAARTAAIGAEQTDSRAAS